MFLRFVCFSFLSLSRTYSHSSLRLCTSSHHFACRTILTVTTNFLKLSWLFEQLVCNNYYYYYYHYNNHYYYYYHYYNLSLYLWYHFMVFFYKYSHCCQNFLSIKNETLKWNACTKSKIAWLREVLNSPFYMILTIKEWL